MFRLRHKMRLDSGRRNTCHALQNGCGCDFVLYDDSPQLPVIRLINAGNFVHRYFLSSRMLLCADPARNNLLECLAGVSAAYFFSAAFTLSGRNIFSAAPVTVRRGTKRCMKTEAAFTKLGSTQCLPPTSPSSPRRATSSAF